MNADILNADEFTFSPYKPERQGDSGTLLLATSTSNPNIRYIVKSDTPELACNEFMYHKVSSALGIYTQEVKLFKGIENKRYAAGIRFSSKATKFSFDVATKLNLHDYYSFQALYIILNEEDSNELYIDEDNRVFKLDNAASFNLDYVFMNMALKLGANSLIAQSLNHRIAFTEYDKYKILLNILTEKFGDTAKSICLETFNQFATFDETKLDKAYETLNEIYPTWLSNYYHDFILFRKAECKRFLSELCNLT